MTAINRFLSALAWKADAVTVGHFEGVIGTPEPTPMEPKELGLGYYPISPNMFPDELYEIKGDKRRLAVALYREGKSLIDSVPYKFFSFFKILNIFWHDKTNRKTGINPLVDGIRAELPNLAYPGSKAQVTAITKEALKHGKDAAGYLYEFGRCAVAHAHMHPIINPDEVDHIYGLSKNILLIEDLADYLIQNKLDLKHSIFA